MIGKLLVGVVGGFCVVFVIGCGIGTAATGDPGRGVVCGVGLVTMAVLSLLKK